MKNLLTKAVVASAVLGMGVVLAPDAQAVTLSFSGVTTSDGSNVTGSFSYTGNTVTSFDFTSNGGSAVTVAQEYDNTTPSDVAGAISGSSVQFTNFSGGQQSQLTIVLDGFTFNDIETDNSILIGQSINLLAATAPFFNNNSTETALVTGGTQTRGITGGFVNVDDKDFTPEEVPEPVTILGTLIAGGFGVAMKKRKEAEANG